MSRSTETSTVSAPAPDVRRKVLREADVYDPSDSGSRRRASRARRLRQMAVALALIAPAALAYGIFVLRPLALTVQYSFYEWSGVPDSPSTFVGLDNYRAVFTDERNLGAILNSIQLIVWFSFVPVILGLITAAIIRKFATSKLTLAARTVMFLPQVIPLVAAGIMWDWMLAGRGVVNTFLGWIGLGGVTRPWLGDIDTALSGVGVIGAWVALGLCMLLLLAGMSKIDPSLYEAARIDGAGPIREFFSITLPSVKQEIGVCVTVTVIAALAAFDIVWATTRGGPARSTMVPGLRIFNLGFSVPGRVGEASALAVVFMALVLLIVLPIQRLTREESR